MTVEEYIDNIDFRPFHLRDRFCADQNIQAFAYKACEMARKEEREMAIEELKTAYKNALYESKYNKGTYRNPIYIFEDLIANGVLTNLMLIMKQMICTRTLLKRLLKCL